MLTYKKASRFVNLHEEIVARKREIAGLRQDIKELKRFILNSGGDQQAAAVDDLLNVKRELDWSVKELDRKVTQLNNLKYGE
jgi:cob(I)alamin adenosyltransferase